METTLIKLREQDFGKITDKPGSFTVTFDEKILINPGDELGLKSCYIDTRSSSTQRIKIDESNNEFSANFGIYWNDHLPTDDFVYTSYTNNDTSIYPTGSRVQPTGDRYYLAQYSGTGAPLANVKILKNLRIVGGSTVESGTKAGRLDFSYLKPAPGGGSVVSHISFTAEPVAHGADIILGNTITPLSPVLDVVYVPQGDGSLEQSFVPSGPKVSGESVHEYWANNYHIYYATGIYSSTLQGESDATDYSNGSIVPVTFTYNFSVPIGDYEPDGLAKLMTDRLTTLNMKEVAGSPRVFEYDETQSNLDIVPKGELVHSCLQISTHALINNPHYGFNGLDSDRDKVLFMSESGRDIIQFNQPGDGTAAPFNYVFGCNLFTVLYDELLNKFSIDQAHLPVMDISTPASKTNQAIIKLMANNGAASSKYIAAHSGVFINSINGSKSSGLFNQAMGFTGDSTLLFEPVTAPQSFTGGVFSNNISTQSCSMVAGQNITEELISIDLGINNVVSDYYKVATATQTEANSNIVNSNNHNGIVANQIKKDGIGQLPDGYFMIEISGLPNTNIINQYSKKIQAICGRFYATTDFTELQDGSGSIPYIHPDGSSPYYISSLSVRILDPNGSCAHGINNNSTIFLQLLKKK